MNQQQTQNLKGYNGNLLLKKSNQQIDWTPELVQEYVKCSNDPVYFIETYNHAYIFQVFVLFLYSD